MTSSIILAFLISGPVVEVAVQDSSGAERHASFPNTKAGVVAFENWLNLNVEMDEETRAHSCVATPGQTDHGFFSSPFFEFAYDNADNTSVWSEARLSANVGTKASAAGMLQACAREFRHLA
jgi:hypothetical protein